jgi:hypothetical protein
MTPRCQNKLHPTTPYGRYRFLPYHSVDKENRIHRRAEVECPVTMISPNGPVPGITQNISLSGAAIRFAEPPPLVASAVRFVFKPRMGHFLVAIAEIAWSSNSEDHEPSGHRMGVRFIHLFEGASLTLKSLIEDHRKDRTVSPQMRQVQGHLEG